MNETIFSWPDEGELITTMPLFEDPWRREILDDLYRFRRGSWEIAKLPDLDGPREFDA